jgi:hypothetical protein
MKEREHQRWCLFSLAIRNIAIITAWAKGQFELTMLIAPASDINIDLASASVQSPQEFRGGLVKRQETLAPLSPAPWLIKNKQLNPGPPRGDNDSPRHMTYPHPTSHALISA